jgi:hypothetical protein
MFACVARLSKHDRDRAVPVFICQANAKALKAKTLAADVLLLDEDAVAWRRKSRRASSRQR